MNIFEIITHLRMLDGSKNKIAFLAENSSNRLLETLLSTIYNPRISFFVTQYEVGESTRTEYDDSEVNDILDFCELLSSRQYTGNEALDFIKEFTAKLSVEAQELFRIVIRRDIQAGIAENTLKKIWNDSIFIEPYMRCSLPKDAKTDITKWPMWYSQLKADGMFATLRSGIDSYISSRQGTIFPESKPFLELINEVKRLSEIHMAYPGIKLSDCVIEGELLISINGVILPREESNGMLNSLQQSGEELPEGAKLIYYVWDLIPASNRVYKGEFKEPYSERFAAISRIFATSELINPIRTRILTDFNEVVKHFLEELENGEEGTIIKLPNAAWKHTKSKEVIKMKIDADVELEVIGTNPAEKLSKYENLFGSLQCKSSDGIIEVGVSSGLTDEMRKSLFEMGDTLIGKIITVRFNDILEPKKEGDLYSLFLPRFVELRLDKREADDFNTIKDVFEEAKKKF